MEPDNPDTVHLQILPYLVGAGGGVEAVEKGSVGIWVYGPCWDRPVVAAEAGSVSSVLLPFQHVPYSEMDPEQEEVPCSVEGSVGSYELHSM